MNKMYTFADGCSVELCSDDTVRIEFNGRLYTFDDKDKPVFDYGTGEIVIEYSGLAVDNRSDQSWAKANYVPKAYAPLHYHKFLTEDYYIVQGKATVMVDGKKQCVPSGGHIQIKPGQQHQVINMSEKDELILIVRCGPSWTKNDYNRVEST